MKNKVLLTFIASVFGLTMICFSLNGQSKKNPENNQKEKQYDIAAFVWPSYHPDDRAKIFWPEGIGEWQTVMNNKPKYDGHEQPRFPLWGYINEADPYVAEMKINAAADHGVNVTPDNFEKALRRAKAYADARSGQVPLITVNTWNEWTETSYLQPCTMHGYGYLEAIRKVFLEEDY